ncbi:MAG TPA: excisionase family DNA-binding protein [Hyphomicrobium sp.]|jgi:excisionase family DNA binding protein|nr:excisionase family DNA-binding protein [Hyphomicrobium sp.]
MPLRENRAAILPPNLPPRGLSRDEAAAYLGLGVTKFDELVAENRMPKPKVVGSRRIWDRKQLDCFFSALPDTEGNAEPDDVWSRACL